MALSNETDTVVLPAVQGDETVRATDQAVDQAKDSLGHLRDRAESSLNASRQQAAEGLGRVAGAVRQAGDRLRSDRRPGVAGLTDSLADQVDRVSGYLRDRDVGDVRDDLKQFARRQPAVALGAVIALGVIGARIFKGGSRHD